MRKLKLLLTAFALMGGVFSANAQTDVTSTYITNAGFEGSHSSYSQPSGDRDIYQPEGWEISYTGGNENDLTSLSSSTTQWSQFSGKPQPDRVQFTAVALLWKQPSFRACPGRLLWTTELLC